MALRTPERAQRAHAALVPTPTSSRAKRVRTCESRREESSSDDKNETEDEDTVVFRLPGVGAINSEEFAKLRKVYEMFKTLPPDAISALNVRPLRETRPSRSRITMGR